MPVTDTVTPGSKKNYHFGFMDNQIMKKVKMLSVVTVCLNCADTIAKTLDSVALQSYDYVEHVIIDGGSVDGTVKIIEEYNVDYFISEPDGGIYHAMEKGIKASNGDVLIFLNSGDLFYDDKVCEDVVEFFNRTDSEIIFGDFCPYLINPDDYYDHECFTPDQVCSLKMVTNRGCLINQNIHHQALFYRREVFDKCTFFTPEWPLGSDYELNVQALVQHGFRAKYFPRIVSKFALGGVSTNNFDLEKQQFKKLSAIIREKYFCTAFQYKENEYVFIPAQQRSFIFKCKLKSSLPYKLAKFVKKNLVDKPFSKISALIVPSFLIQEFWERTDSIYKGIIDNCERIDKLSSQTAEVKKSLIEILENNVARQHDYQIGINKKQDSLQDSLQEAINGIQIELAQQRDYQIGINKKQDSLQEAINGIQIELAQQRDYQIGINKKQDSLQDSLQEAINGIQIEFAQQRDYQFGIKSKIDIQREIIYESNKRLKNVISDVYFGLSQLNKNENINLARVLNEQQRCFSDISQAGYKVNSQFDEDGIIQYLLNWIKIPNKIFVEFGVENYSEANTRLLLEKDNWSGLVIDSCKEHIDQIKASEIYWRYNLQAVCAFITRENINMLILNMGISGDIGLLSVDIDGIDYWVWEAIEVISPRIVICEYNAIFGYESKVTVPYDPKFDRAKKHYSYLYAGASLSALAELGKKKGYSLVASNSAGNNAFFVRCDCMDNLKEKITREAYIKAQFRESRDPEGKMTYLSIEEGIKLLNDLTVFNLETSRETKIKELKIKYD
jgi:glycosyltransferase involved in cell wall biosynthesis/ribosome modulation factor